MPSNGHRWKMGLSVVGRRAATSPLVGRSMALMEKRLDADGARVSDAGKVRGLIRGVVESHVLWSSSATRWRKPLIGFAAADDTGFSELARRAGVPHALPRDVMPGARSVVSFFLPFDARITQANAKDPRDVAREWAVAYVETNAAIERITNDLIARLASAGVGAAAVPPTGRFDRATLTSTWSHKSVAVVTGLGSIGVHSMLITDSGCAGRLGSLVVDADVATEPVPFRERCRHRAGGKCLECLKLCPVGALRSDGTIDRERCWARCKSVATGFTDIGVAQVCGKCATGPCASSTAS